MARSKHLLKRAQMVGLSNVALAKAAKLHVQTVGSIESDRPRGAVAATADRLEAALEARELEVLDELLPRHIDARLERISEILRAKGFRLERSAA